MVSNMQVIYEEYGLDPVEIIVKAGESLKYEVLDKPTRKRTFIIEQNASLEYLELSISSTLEDLDVKLIGENASFKAEILVVANKDSLKFNQKIYHEARNTTSNITNFAVALDKANLDFRTTGAILNKMSGSNCRQLCRGIIIGDAASITSEPILLIDEFDVMASHGAAIGKMSDEEMFYLMSRGLTKEESLSLIVEGLTKPFLDKISQKETYLEAISKLIRG